MILICFTVETAAKSVPAAVLQRVIVTQENLKSLTNTENPKNEDGNLWHLYW
jgi:hypothetical protein